MTETRPMLLPYFPPKTKTVGTDVDPKALLAIYGPSGAGKSHLIMQLLDDPDIGRDEVLCIVREDVTSIYGPGARVLYADRFDEAKEIARDLLAQAQAGRRLPKIIATDSASGLALGTQAWFREHPIEAINTKTGEMARNKFAEFGELGTGFIDYMLLLMQLPVINVVLCTTYENPTKPGSQPEIAVEGQMIPKFFTQMTTSSLYLSKVEVTYPREAIELAKAKGTLEQSHRIVVPWGPADPTVKAIERYLIAQGGGEVLCKGHRNLGVREKADLPAVLRKMMGRV